MRGIRRYLLTIQTATLSSAFARPNSTSRCHQRANFSRRHVNSDSHHLFNSHGHSSIAWAHIDPNLTITTSHQV